MALYETLIEGGHEHLIDAVKARIAQKADAIIEEELKPIIENQPSATLEGELLTAEDAAVLPPVEVHVNGRSTQASTTGKNLLPPSDEYYTRRSVNGTVMRTLAIPVSEDESLTWHRNLLGGITIDAYWCDELGDSVDATLISNLQSYSDYPFTNFDGHAYCLFTLATNYNLSLLVSREGQIERGWQFTGYEPYSGGVPSPSPGWPQEIAGIGKVALVMPSKNIINWASPFRTGSYHYDIAVGTVITTGRSANVEVSMDDDTVTVVINAGWNGALWHSPILPNGTYHMHFQKTGSSDTSGTSVGTTLFVVDKNNKCVRKIGTHAVSGDWDHTITLSDDEAAICVCTGTRSGTTGTYMYAMPQLEVGSVATSYEPYSTITVPINKGECVLHSLYDGTKDELLLTYLKPSAREGWAWYAREMVQRVGVADLGELTWTGYTYSEHLVFRTTKLTTSRTGLCTALAISTTNSPAALPDNSICLHTTGWSSGGHMMARADAYESVAAFKSGMSGVLVQYVLATPITHDLGEIELPVLPAPNCTVWSNPTADLKLTYVIDSETIEESLESGIGKAFSSVAPVETSPATDSHGVGSRIVYNETLYKVTSAIAAGEDIVPGTNVTATTVAAELLATQA